MRKAVVFAVWIVLISALCGGCATKPTDPEHLRIYEQNNDPLEPLNRVTFGFNQSVNRFVLKPAARGYRAVVPELVRTGVNNFFDNLKQPVYLINALLQGEGKTAGQIFGRFAANTFWGFFGVFDTASAMNIPVVKRDFGQTLAVWGADSGPYIVLPLLGPATVRDAIGIGADSVMNPIDWTFYDNPRVTYGVWGVNGLRAMEQGMDLLDNMERSSTDFYATWRSMYQQNRQKEIRDLVQKPDTADAGNSSVGSAAYEFDFPDDDFDDE